MIPEEKAYPQDLIRQPLKKLHACALPMPYDGETMEKTDALALAEGVSVLSAEYNSGLRKAFVRPAQKNF